MDLYRISVYAHLFLAIILVGLGLFWFIMLVALRQKFDAAETERLLRVANAARWPHVAVPYKLRLPLPFMTWAVLVLLAVTGIEIIHLNGMPATTGWWIKVALLGVLAILQAVLTIRPAPLLIRLNIVCVLALIVVSALMIRA
jgi:hypothetical protein